MHEEKNKLINIIKFIFFIVLILTVFIIVRFTKIGVILSGNLKQINQLVAALGFWGYGFYLVIYIVGVIIVFPGSLLTILAGGLFGLVKGTILVSIGSTIGASFAFLISRYFARNAVSNRINKNDKFKKLDDLTEKHGSIIVAVTSLVRLFPFNLLNYGFGLTKIKFYTYFFWSWLCMLPGTVLYVVGTDAIKTAIQERKIPWVLVIIFIILFAVITLLVGYAKNTLSKKVKTNQGVV